MSTNNSDEFTSFNDPAGTAGHGQASFDDVRKGRPPGTKLAMAIMCLIGTAVGLGIIYIWFNRPITESQQNDGPELANTLPALKLGTKAITEIPEGVFPQESQLMFTPPPETEKPLMPDFQIIPDPVHARRLRSRMQAESNGETSSVAGTSSQSGYIESGSFAGKLEPLRLAPSVAGKLGNRDYLITQGTMIDCGLRPKLISTQTGMFTCIAPSDTYSANGRVKLIDKGTKFVGFQSGGLTQGQDRIFVVWSRLETPSGVIVNLDSPGTGPLGEAGLGGNVDHHFMERFGNAIMLSLIFDLSNYATSRRSSNESISFDNTTDGAQDAIGKVLEHSMDIPPTLYKNQGERVSILVARDLDFSKVYDLKPANSRFR